MLALILTSIPRASAGVDGLNSSSWNPRFENRLEFEPDEETSQTKFAPGNLRPAPEVNVTIPRSRSCRSLATNRSIPEWLEKKARIYAVQTSSPGCSESPSTPSETNVSTCTPPPCHGLGSLYDPLFAPGPRTRMAEINILDFGPKRVAGESASWYSMYLASSLWLSLEVCLPSCAPPRLSTAIPRARGRLV